MYRFLFLDLDDTILDFQKAEKNALCQTLTTFGISPTEEICSRYSAINKAHWQRLERKELTRAEVLLGRFATLIDELGLSVDAAVCAQRYEERLSHGHDFLPGAYDALVRLSRSYRLFLASNGTKSVQQRRIASAGIAPFFENIFISQEIGANKPDIAYFRRCFSQIPDFVPEEALIVGDSLSSDILGGRNAGISTCWINPRHLPKYPDILADYEIETLTQLYPLLEAL